MLFIIKKYRSNQFFCFVFLSFFYRELLESEQIKRTQTLEKRLRTLYKRLEEHQTNTESLHFHLAAQMEALQSQV